MAKEKKAKSASKGMIGGAFQGGSAMGVLYELMEDGKNHSLGSIKSAIGKLASNVSNRVSLLHRTGKANGKWYVVKDDDKVKMVFGKFKGEKKADKPEKSSSKKEKSAPKKKSNGGKPKVQDVPSEEDAD